MQFILKKIDILFLAFFLMFIFNNILRFYPFPVNFTQDDQKNIESNLPGIIFNLLFFASLLIELLSQKFFSIKEKSIKNKASVLLILYCLGIFLQIFVRSHFIIETIRSFSYIIHFLSIILLSEYIFTGNTEKIFKKTDFFIKTIIISFISTLIIGILIGFIKPGSVNWGHLGGHVGDIRGEFFFFHINPVIGFTSILAYLLCSKNLSFFKQVSLVFLLGICLLAVGLTRTRAYLIPILISTFLSGILLLRFCLLRMKKKSIIIFLSVFLSVFFIFIFLYNEKALSLFQRIASYARIDFWSNREPDWTNARGELNRYALQLFYNRPLIGYGTEETRLLISESYAAAKTEHGYTMHLATFGIFAFLFFSYILYAFYAALKNFQILMFKIHFISPKISALIFSASLLTFSGVLTGFFGTFGAITGISDWLFLLYCQLSIQGYSYLTSNLSSFKSKNYFNQNV